MLKTNDRGLDLAKVKEVTFGASYTEMGDKLIIIVPKNYHNDVKKMGKPVEVIVQDLESD